MKEYITEIKENSDGGITASARVPGTSLLFSGHFPDDPIVPGIAQLGLVSEMLRQSGSARRPRQVRRIRFKRVIRPDEIMWIHIFPPDGACDIRKFKVVVGGKTACSGTMIL